MINDNDIYWWIIAGSLQGEAQWVCYVISVVMKVPVFEYNDTLFELKLFS